MSYEVYEIRFPRVEGYTQAIRNRVTVPDWSKVPSLVLLPDKIPPEVEMKALTVNNAGRQSLIGPGRIGRADLQAFRPQRRLQELVFEFARTLTRGTLPNRNAKHQRTCCFLRWLTSFVVT